MRTHAAALGALFLSGCASLVTTPYATPKLEVPGAWRNATGPATELRQQGQWWRNFNDPALEALVQEVLRRNSDLAVAALAVRRARLQAGLTDRNSLPQVSASLGASAGRNLRGEPNPSHGVSASAGISYEADLWGKLALQRDTAHWAAQASEQDRQSLALSLTGTTMGLYWKLGYVNQRIELAAQSIAHAQQALQVARVKHAAGLIASLDVLQAEQALASQRAELTQLRSQREENLSALALLFDAPPGEAMPEPRQLPEGAYPLIAAGLPAQLLARRPDLQAAELRLRSTLAAGDLSRMNFYPPLALTGSLGSSSEALLAVLRNPAAGLGASLALPFLQWKEMKVNGKLAQIDYESAVSGFRQAFYRALAEVENALSQCNQLAEQADYLELALATARKAERIAELQYRAGSVPIKAWLDAQEARRSAASTVAANRLERLVAHVAVYQALGGDATVGVAARPAS